MPLDQSGEFSRGPGRDPALNVLGGALQPCSTAPLTGFFRDGCCHVCAVVTAAFLQFSQQRGNDLSTPRPEYSFPGLQPGDRWCLCASRWQEALQDGCAPLVALEATHAGALDHCALADLQRHALPA